MGSGPNGLAAAGYLAHAGLAVLVLEEAATLGGGVRTTELTLPGFRHDVCSAIYPLAIASPFFGDLPLHEHGLEWVHPGLPAAHPLDGGRAVLFHRSIQETAAGLGRDERAWRRLFEPLVESWDVLRHQFLGPVRLPRDPLAVTRFGLLALRSLRGLADSWFRERDPKTLLAGMTGHAFLPLSYPTSAGFGLMLGLAAHTGGWPMPRGGARALAEALVSYARTLGTEFETGVTVSSLSDLPPARLVLLDTTPHEAMRIVGYRLPVVRRAQLGSFRHGPGVFKLDYALSGPVPWEAEGVERAGTVHVGGDIDEIAGSEEQVARGQHPQRPFLLAAQPTRFDPSRAPEGMHTLWAYAHVPNGSNVDMTDRMEAQIERFAPGFRDLIVARHAMTPADVETYNRNNVGGDISGGANDGLQLFLRPRLGLDPYFVQERAGRTVFLCSSSTPPGGGVHGMCGYHAARLALRRLNRSRT
ncbi:MAG: NAD(P)/FAD-dependent oxidoreductase [Actinomycetota bacterium]|nr:NAD(P)/FAD-dependent oxidoreductase [Actinomycetota bacterium]